MGADLSIVTVTRNDASGLRRTLTSIREQDLPPLEVVVVDGMSQDETPDVVRELSLSHWQYVREPDAGIYDAMNKGWRRASGEYVQFLNSGDAWLDASSLGQWWRAVALTPDTTWSVCGAVTTVAGEPVVIGNLPHSWWRHAWGMQPHCHQACLFRRKLLEALGGMDDSWSFAADHDLVMRAGMAAVPFAVPAVLIDYQAGGMSEQRIREIPRLLHDIRVARLQLGGALSAVDRLWATCGRAAQEAVRLRDRARALNSRL